EVLFTSGGTEGDNLAIKGVGEAYKSKGDHIITVVTEHKAVLDSCKHLQKSGLQVTYLPVQKDGLIDLEQFSLAFTEKTILVSVMHANNEIGVLQPIAEIGQLCRERGVLFHTDAAQSIAKAPVNIAKHNIDLLSLSGHKLYGPKGVGALSVREGVQLSPIIDGGGHEHGMRSGTLNVPGIVGLGKACAIASEEMPKEACHTAGFRNRLRDRILGSLDDCYVNGSMDQRLPGNLNMSFAGVDGQALIMGLSDVAVSSGAACTSAKVEPSYVLKALGLSDELANSSLRFGIGRFNSEAEIDFVAERVIEVIKQLREISL